MFVTTLYVVLVVEFAREILTGHDGMLSPGKTASRVWYAEQLLFWSCSAMDHSVGTLL